MIVSNVIKFVFVAKPFQKFKLAKSLIEIVLFCLITAPKIN
jgi:hypothetical protein